MKNCFYIYFLYLMLSSFLFADLKYEKINGIEELSSHDIQCIYQDKNGFLWIGTYNGLNRYDGYSFKKYFHDPFDSTSLSSNHIRCVFEDRAGLLWIGTEDGGLNKFDRNTGLFSRYMHDPGNPESISCDTIRFIFEDINNNLWIGTEGGGLNKFDNNRKTFFAYRHNPNNSNSISSDLVFCYSYDKNGIIWIGTIIGGLNKFDTKTNSFTHYLPYPNKHNYKDRHKYTDRNDSIWDNNILSVKEYNAGELLISPNRDLLRFNKNTGKFTPFFSETENPRLNLPCYYYVFEDKQGKIWLGTFSNKLVIYDSITNKLIEHIVDKEDKYTLTSSSVSAIYKDHSGITWLGTFGGGLKKIGHKKNPFKYYSISNNNAKNKPYSISAIYQDKNKIIWLGTPGDGLLKYNNNTGSYTQYQQNSKRSTGPVGNWIVFLYGDNENNLWIGTTSDGLSCINLDNDRFKHYIHDPKNENSLNGNFIWLITKDKNNNMWFVAKYGGINMYRKYSDDFIRPEISNPQLTNIKIITSLLFDQKNNFWIGTESSGIFKFSDDFSSSTRYFKDNNNPNSLFHNNIFLLFEDSKGNIWISAGCLQKLDPNTNTIKYYNENNGVFRGSVFSILEDHKGVLWLSSDRGIIRFNPETEQYKSFTTENGLPFDMFNPEVSFQNDDGEMFFGGSKGFISFFPDSVIDNPHIPPIVITELIIKNKSIENSRTIEDLFYKNEKINLSYNDYQVSIKFSALDFYKPEQNQYAYKMEGVDPDWIYVNSNQRIAAYTNLDAGEYVFKVKGSNNDGIWNNNPASVTLKVLPPPWKTWWAYSIYFIIIVFTLYLFRDYDLKRQRLKHELEMEQLNAEKLVEVDRMKSRFFANISHEFRTPLTLILGHLEAFINGHIKNDIQKQYKLMHNNAKNLLRLINQLLDLSKLEAGRLSLKAQKTNINRFLGSIISAFSSLAEFKQITLKYRCPKDKIYLFVDHDKIEKVFNNLLSNALKFTPEGGIIVVKIEKNNTDQILNGNNNYVKITFNNSGRSIYEEQLTKIFERFYQLDTSITHNQGGTGIGLALTKELISLHYGEIFVKSNSEHGTTFTISLPMGKEHLKEDEIENNFEQSDISFKDKIRPEEIDIPDEKVSPLVINHANSNVKNYRVLIVEDNQDMQLFLEEGLAVDYNIIKARNGKIGFDLAAKKLPDLIISDVMMPEMDGYQLCNKVKNDIRVSHIPLILLTARVDIESKLTGLETGADDYVSKPFNMKELKIRVKNLIEQRIKLREHFSKIITVEPGDITSSTLDEVFLRKVLKVVENYLSDPDLSVDMLVDVAGVSRAQLYRKIKSLTGLSVKAFVRNIRLKRAAQFLSGNKGNIAEISFEVGFNNPSYFTECFQKQFGTLPSKYLSHKSPEKQLINPVTN